MATQSAIRAGRAFVELFADDSALVRTLRRAEARVVKFGENIKAIGRRLTALGLAAGVPFAASMKVFRDFDDQMRFAKSTTQATGEEFQRLTAKAKLLGRTTSFTASQVAGAMAELGLAGFSVDEIDNATQSMLDLARATRTDLAEATEIAAGTLRAFEIPAKDMARVGDVLVATATNSATKLTDLGEAMAYAAPLAEQYGMSLETTAKALGSLSNFNIKGSMAGTTLRRLMTNFSDNNVQKKLRGIGVSVIDQDTGKMRDVADILRDIGTATASMPSGQKLGFFKQIFGLWAIAGGASLTTAHFDKLIEAVDNAAGTSRRAAKEMDTGIGGSLRMMWSAIEGVAIAVGEALAPSLQKLTDWFTRAASGMVDYLTRNKQIVVQAAKVVSAITGIGVGLLVFGGTLIAIGKTIGVVATIIGVIAKVGLMGFSILSGAISVIPIIVGAAITAFSGLVSIVGIVIGGIGTALSTLATIGATVFGAIGSVIAAAFTPLGMIVIALAAIAVACVLVYRNASAIGNSISGVFSTTTGAISRAINAVYSFLNQFTEFKIIFGIIGFVNDAIIFFGRTLLWVANSIVRPVLSIVFSLFRQLVSISMSSFREVSSVVVTQLELVFRMIGSVFRGMVSIATGAMRTMISVAGTAFGTLAGIVGRALNPVFGIISSVFRGIIRAVTPIASIFKTVIGAVVSFARSFFVVETSIQSVSAISKVVGTLISVFRNISDIAFSAFSTIIRSVPSVVSYIVSDFWSLPSNISTVFSSIAGIVSNAFSGVLNIVRSVVSGIGNIFSGLGNMIAGFGNFFLGAFANIGVAVDWLRGQFGKLLSFTTETFGAIVAAIGRGDIEAAIGVVWTTIQLIWAKGCNLVIGTWYGMIDSLQGAWNSVQQFWNTTVYAMRLAWSELSNGIVNDWKWVEQQIARGVGYVIAQLEGLDPAELDAEINADYKRQATARESAKNRNQEKANADFEASKTKLADLRQGQQDAYNAKLAPLEQAERDAKEAYNKAIEAAQNPTATKESVEQETLLDKLSKTVEGVLGNFSAVNMAEKADAYSSNGTFSAFAVNTVAENNYAKITADAAMETNKRLAAIERLLGEEGDLI